MSNAKRPRYGGHIEQMREYVLLSEAAEHLYALNAFLKSHQMVKHTSTVNMIQQIQNAAKKLDYSFNKVMSILRVPYALRKAIQDLIDTDVNTLDEKMVTYIIELKDDYLEHVKVLLFELFEEKIRQFMLENDKELEPEQNNLKDFESMLDDADEDLNDLEDELNKLANKMRQKDFGPEMALEELNKIRHSARALDNSYNEIGATILGTTAVPLHGALHEYLGSIDATITAKDADRLEIFAKLFKSQRGYLNQLRQALMPQPTTAPGTRGY